MATCIRNQNTNAKEKRTMNFFEYYLP